MNNPSRTSGIARFKGRNPASPNIQRAARRRDAATPDDSHEVLLTLRMFSRPAALAELGTQDELVDQESGAAHMLGDVCYSRGREQSLAPMQTDMAKLIRNKAKARHLRL